MREFSFKAHLLALNGADKESLERFSKLYFPELERIEQEKREELKKIFEELTKEL